MTIHEAAALLRTPHIDSARPQVWCDLGCGEGLFTLALATLLAPGSTIYAVDQNELALRRIPEDHDGVSIHKSRQDLNHGSLQLPSVDGILMANVLHFIPEQESLLKRLRELTKQLLIVEYERSRSSRWNPYPVPFQRLVDLFEAAGVHSATQIGTRRSRFGGIMYSAFARSAQRIDSPRRFPLRS